ncbi:MAG TPA: hypothetical protein VGO61_21585 [Steroidobacteraceae bacterium]|jgi:hypothetical protein|nr:hypothetical protein [Steroidobacteraceae bacterium]
MSRIRTISTLACALALGVSSTLASAAEKRARFTVEVKIEGTEGVIGNGADRTSGKFREGYTLVTYLKSDGELAQFNTKDPEYAQKMMGLSAAVHQRAAGKSSAKKMKPQEFKEYMQKKQAACNGEQSCLYKLAMEAQQLSANLETGAPAGPAYTGDEPPRYLTYFGYDKCGAAAHVYVDRTTQGTVGDTGGAVPYTIHDTADYTDNPTELGLICNLHQAIFDTQDGSIYTDGAILPTARGNSTMVMRGKTENSTGEASTHGEPYTWVSEQLRHVPRAGTRSTTLKLTQNQGASIHSGKYTGEARVQLTWKFEDVK